MLCPSCGTDAGDVSRFCPSCGASIVRAAEGDEYIGKTIGGKYRVEEMIGEGGMGKVYRARQMMLDKQVVLKVLRQALLSDERTVARFGREAKAASRLNHPNSISILDFGQADDGALYIAMEYVHGKDLHQILSREWPLPEARVVRIMSQVLGALADAHSAGVIHRDLKPENIMVEQRRNEPDFVKVLDFGIAKIQDQAGDDGPALTKAGFVCGTPEYMSPEQARGSTLDHRSDLYAVGVILYQLTTGLLPFESDSAVGFATKHLTAEPPLPTRRRPDARISAGMERLIMKALSKDPNDRPGTAEQFRAELAAVDKERRAGHSARRAGVSSPVLSPIPRKQTPVDQAETRVQGPSPWLSAETTVRANPPADMTVVGTATAADPSLEGGTGLLIFKVVTVALVLFSVGLAGWYLYTLYYGGEAPPVVQYENAPTPVADPVRITPEDQRPLYEQDLPRDESQRAEALRLAHEGYVHLVQLQLGHAATKYKLAFEKYPDPSFALALGEIYLQRDEMKEARGWFARHLEDAPDSRALPYINARFSDLK